MLKACVESGEWARQYWSICMMMVTSAVPLKLGSLPRSRFMSSLGTMASTGMCPEPRTRGGYTATPPLYRYIPHGPKPSVGLSVCPEESTYQASKYSVPIGGGTAVVVVVVLSHCSGGGEAHYSRALLASRTLKVEALIKLCTKAMGVGDDTIHSHLINNELISLQWVRQLT